MAEHKDRVQQAADALEALSADRPEGAQAQTAPDAEAAPAGRPPPAARPQQPPSSAPAPAEPSPTAPVGPPPASQPPPARPSAALPPVRVTIKSPGKPPLTTAGPSPKAAAPETPKKAEPPRPPLRPLDRVVLARRIALRRTVIPILLTTGLAMLLLGSWAVSVLVFERVPFRPHTEVDVSTRFFARVCLLAWPIGLTLLGGVAFLMAQVYRYYRGEGRKE